MFAYLMLAGFMASAGAAGAQTAAPPLQHAVIHEDAAPRHIERAHPFLHRAADLGCSHYSGDYSHRCYRRRADPYYGRHDRRRPGRYDDHRYRDGDRYYRHDRRHGRYGRDRYDRHDYRGDRLRDHYGRPYSDYRERERYRRPYRPGGFDRRFHRRPFDRSRHDLRGDDRRIDRFRESATPSLRRPHEPRLMPASHRDDRFYKKKDTATTAMTGKRLAGSDAGSTV